MRILACADSFSDGCAFYRSVGPWSALAKKNPDLQVTYVNRPDWADIRLHDILFMQRPSSADLKSAFNAAKQFGTKLWVDFDDDLFSVPRDNPAYEIYAGRHQQMKLFIEGADLVTVTTAALREKLSSMSKVVQVLPNAMDDCLLKYVPKEPANNVILWRGTATHNRDVASVSKELVAIATKYPEYTFAFLGCDPCAWDVSEKMKHPVVITTPMTPVTLFSSICFLRPKIVIVPLQDIHFNRCKSNIAALEASLAGAAVLAPNWPEWSFDGITRYGNPSDFADRLEDLINQSTRTKALAEEAWGFVTSRLLLSMVNEQRLQLAKNLVYSKE